MTLIRSARAVVAVTFVAGLLAGCSQSAPVAQPTRPSKACTGSSAGCLDVFTAMLAERTMAAAKGAPAAREHYETALQSLNGISTPFDVASYSAVTGNPPSTEPTDGPDWRPVHFHVALFSGPGTPSVVGIYWACLGHVKVVVTPQPCPKD